MGGTAHHSGRPSHDRREHPIDSPAGPEHPPAEPAWFTGEWHEEPGVLRARRRTMRTLLIAQVAGALGVGAGPSVGVLMAAEVTSSETWAGLARASTTVGAAVFSLLLGMLAARRGRRVSLTLAWSIAGAGAALLTTAPVLRSTPLLVVGMLALGAGSAAGMQSRFAATDLAAPAHRARSLALVVWVGTLGAVLGPNLGAPGTVLETWTGLPPLSGAFALSALLLTLTATVVALGLRPDPLQLARLHTRAADADGDTSAGPRTSSSGTSASAHVRMPAALREVWRLPTGRFALVALVLAHVAMVSVMTMTPVHLSHGGGSITLIGLTISLHVLGMFALAPVFGAAADRFGPVPVILAGQAVLAAAALTGVLGAGSQEAVALALLLLGLGWSVVTVPASSLLTESVPARNRPLVQGAGDASMNAAAALGAIASGPLMAVAGFEGLSVVAGLTVVPVLLLGRVLRRQRVPQQARAV